MSRVLVGLCLLSAFVIVTVSPIFDFVIVNGYEQVNHHRLGFPLPIIEQHTTLTPLDESFPFRLGLLDPREHPTDLLIGNYLVSIISIAVILIAILWALNWLIRTNKKKNST